jgi:hypothetical protein
MENAFDHVIIHPRQEDLQLSSNEMSMETYARLYSCGMKMWKKVAFIGPACFVSICIFIYSQSQSSQGSVDFAWNENEYLVVL